LLGSEGYILIYSSSDGYTGRLKPQGRRLLQAIEAEHSRPPSTRDVQQHILAYLFGQSGSDSAPNIAQALGYDRQLVDMNLGLMETDKLVTLRYFISPEGGAHADLTPLGYTIAREPNYQPRSTAPITTISTGGGNYVDTGGGDYAERDIDKRQGTNFYNAGREIAFSAVQNRQDLLLELEKLRAGLSRAAEDPAMDTEVILDAEHQVRKAIVQAKKLDADKKTVLDRLDEAKALLAEVGAAGAAIEALAKAAEWVQKLF
jgi:hypothetical protein